MDKFLITSRDYYDNIESRLARALGLGVTKLYFREFSIDRFHIFSRLCAKYNISLFVHFKFALDYDLINDVQGIHLKSTDLNVVNNLPADVSLSYSAHSIDDVVLAYDAGVDYIFLSPIFNVEGKMPPLGLDYIRRIPANYKSRIYALGGINMTNIDCFLDIGIKGIAGIRLFL